MRFSLSVRPLVTRGCPERDNAVWHRGLECEPQLETGSQNNPFPSWAIPTLSGQYCGNERRGFDAAVSSDDKIVDAEGEQA